MQEHRKIAKQIASLAQKVKDVDVLLDIRNELIAICHENNVPVLKTEECPPADPDCLPPENPPPDPDE